MNKQIENTATVLKFPQNIVVPIETKLPETKSIGPIERDLRATLERLKGTRYEDTFDWSIYDKIANRFGDEQPRGGVIFNTNLKLVNFHASCTKCHYAFEIDSYGRGCIHNCAYCYAKEALTAHGYWNRPMPFPVNLAEVRKIFYTVFETTKSSRWRPILEKRIPLRIGSMSDSFMWMDKKYKVTKELLKILSFYDYPYVVFTRSDLVADDEYLAVLRKDLASVQFSISGGNEVITRQIESGAPTVDRRLKALTKLAENGFWTTVRINPFFPIYPDGYFTNPKSVIERFGSLDAAPKFDLFDWSFIKELKDAKVGSLLAGVVRLSNAGIRDLSKATGTDFRLFFDEKLIKSNLDKKYSDSEIAYYYKRLQVECAKNGIRFNTCYIGNGEKDYYQYQNLWSNKADCCDVKGNVGAFNSSSQNVPWEIRTKHAPSKEAAEAAMKSENEAEIKYSELTSSIDRLGLRVVLPNAMEKPRGAEA